MSDIVTSSELTKTPKWESLISWSISRGWFNNNKIVERSSCASAYSIENSGIHQKDQS